MKISRVNCTKIKRHELLNETNKEVVYKDVLDFFYAS